MNTAFQYFMTGILDYAGLFPPAQLDINTAVKNFQTYQQTDNNWMLSKFVISEEKLTSINPPANMTFSVILSDSDSERPVNGTESWKSQIASFETRLPEDGSTIEHTTFFLHRIVRKLEAAGIDPTRLFIESAAPDLSDADILAIKKFRRHSGHEFGYKLRCGGPSSTAVPNPDQVVITIRACIKNDLPIKFTAGLHHPISQHSASQDILTYGFINMFTAALLGFDGQISDAAMKMCLTDPRVENFHFDDNHLVWNEHTIPVDRIKHLRRKRIISFGSCSFEEPVNDLKDLNYL